MVTSKLKSRFFHHDTRRRPRVFVPAPELMVKLLRFTLRGIVLIIRAEWITG